MADRPSAIRLRQGFGWQATTCLPKLREERRRTGAIMSCVYFLRPSNGDDYVASTNDLRRRVDSHQRGCVDSTKACLPVADIGMIAVAPIR